MKPSTKNLIFGRRIHNALRYAIEDGDGKTDDNWLNIERPIFEHSLCGLYLTGTLSFLEGKLGTFSWNKPGKSHADFTAFITSLTGSKKEAIADKGISSSSLDALVCIRNAITHNNNDLSKNHDTKCLNKVQNENIPKISISNGVITMASNNNEDFKKTFLTHISQINLNL
jgi:hypothetical protein